MADTRIDQLEARVMALRMVTAGAWSNTLGHVASDPIATARELAGQMDDEVGVALADERVREDPLLAGTIHRIRSELRSFWQYVEEMLEKRPPSHPQ